MKHYIIRYTVPSNGRQCEHAASSIEEAERWAAKHLQGNTDFLIIGCDDGWTAERGETPAFRAYTKGRL